MRGVIRGAVVSAILLLPVGAAVASPSLSPADARDSVVIVFKDGHRQSLATAEIARIEVKAPAAIVYKDGHREKISGEIERVEFGDTEVAMTPGRNHFVGKWEVGEGSGGGHFFITLDADGSARKSLGSPHGTWTLVDGEAHISWDDGWQDAIRKVGSKHEKVAHEPGNFVRRCPVQCHRCSKYGAAADLDAAVRSGRPGLEAAFRPSHWTYSTQVFSNVFSNPVWI